MKQIKKILAGVLTAALLLACLPTMAFSFASAEGEGEVTTYAPESDSQKEAVLAMAKHYTSYVVVKNRPLGGSHYAYTEASTDQTGDYEQSPSGSEHAYRPGSEMVRLDLLPDGSRKETLLLRSDLTGLIRDPDVSADGKTVLFSYKRNNKDDFHLYTMDLTAEKPVNTLKQLTFGSAVTDTEPKYLPNGKIVFSSSRCIQSVDCWHTTVSNLYICDADGQNIIRVGYDQVHTTYPTVTSDGRVIYTRWDYNDRNQMYIQGIFQMQQDGTNQTELFGNNMSWPTTLLHSREIPGTTDKYVSIVSGHHTYQAGKMVVVDLSKGRNDKDAVDYVYPEDNTHSDDINKKDGVDGLGQHGPLYRYPVALSDHEFLVSYAPDGYYDNDGNPTSGGDKDYTPFHIYYMNTETGVREIVSEAITGATYKDTIAASQIVPIATRELFNRPSMVNYGKDTGTVYVGNVYEGEGMEGVDPAKQEAKYLRVVELEFRSYSIGANIGRGTGSSDPYSPVSAGNGSWDVKTILGIVPIEPDGSALFEVPADTPIFFQVLDAEGEIMQTMRSWATLMPGETFSCVGCHEDKNTVPPSSAGVSMAMKKGVQKLQKDLWMVGEKYEDYDPYTDAEGFSYTENVQPILDKSCVSCHNNQDAAYELLETPTAKAQEGTLPILNTKMTGWEMTTSTPTTGWNTPDGFANKTGWEQNKLGGFGNGEPSALGNPNTTWDSSSIYLRRSFNVGDTLYSNLTSGKIMQVFLDIAYDEDPKVYLNGTLIFEKSGYTSVYEQVDITAAFKANVRKGTNYLAVTASQKSGGQYIDVGISYPDTTSGTYMLVANKASGWQFRNSTPSNTNTWYTAAGFSDTANWQLNKTGGFGTQTASFDAPNTVWNNNVIYIRRTFDVTADMLAAIQKASKVSLFIGYDEAPTLYLNGEQLVSYTGYNSKLEEKDITAAFKSLVKEGTNYLAVSGSQTAGGQYLDVGIGFAVEKLDITEKDDVLQADPITLLDKAQSGWQYKASVEDGADWYQPESFADTEGWELNKTGPFGRTNSYWTAGTNWTSKGVSIRRTFEVSEELYAEIQAGAIDDVTLFVLFDEDPRVYLNGKELFSQNGFTKTYEAKDVSAAFKRWVRPGTNYLAASASNNAGDQVLDLSITYTERVYDPNVRPFSLEGVDVIGKREKINYLMSYLVLTGSKWINCSAGGEYLATPENRFTNWVSSMSQCEVLDVYQNGSAVSTVIAMLENGHMGVELTDAELNTLRAWIDMGVPFRGAYDEATVWGKNEVREATAKDNKRAYYDTIDETTKAVLAGVIPQTADNQLTISYYKKVNGADTLVKTVTGYGVVDLTPDTAEPLVTGNKIVVELPAGQEYLAFTLTNIAKESILYVPGGKFTYEVPEDVNKILPKNSLLYPYPSMSARIPSDEELVADRLLSVNTYDTYEGNGSYPHASASNNYGKQPMGNAEFEARNAIDGFVVNQGHGAWPLQSWGPDQNVEDLWWKVDFGHEVEVNRLVIYLRADFDHDAPFTGVVAKFSDGSTLDLGGLEKTAEPQEFILPERVTTSSVQLLLEGTPNKWCALTEVEVYGGEIPEVIPGDTDLNGTVAANDALLALQYATKKVVLEARQLLAAEVDAKGDVTANDALMILQASTKKITLESTAGLPTITDLENELAAELDKTLYTDVTYAAYEQAKSAAQKTLEDSSADRWDYKKAIEDLRAAKTALERKADKVALAEVINKQLNESLYTAESLKAYKDAVAAAQKVYDNPSATQSESNTAIQDINMALDKLERVDTIPVLATFSSFNKEYTAANGNFHGGNNMYADWKNADKKPIDLEYGRDGLYLIMTVTFNTEEDIDLTKVFEKMVVKLRSNDKANVPGDTQAGNTEHNYGWDLAPSSSEITTTDTPGVYKVAIPLTKACTNKRGVMDWAKTERIITQVIISDAGNYRALATDNKLTMTISDTQIVNGNGFDLDGWKAQ